MSTPAYATRFVGGYAQYATSWTDSEQSAVPSAVTGLAVFASGTAMKVALPANNANGTPTGAPASGASAPSGNYQRCEVYPAVAGLGCVNADGDIYAGATGYFGLSVMFDSPFPTTTTTWQVISQWKNDGTGSPPLELKVGNGYLYLDGNSGGWSYNLCPVTPGGQYNLVFGFTFTEAASTSYINAWVNGNQVLSNVHPVGIGLLYPGIGDYWKVGIYRDSAIQPAATVYYGAIAHDAAYQPVADYIAATTVAASPPPPPPTPPVVSPGGAAPGQSDNTPMDLFATVQQMLAGLNPDQGRQAMLIEAMHLCHDELAMQGLSAPQSLGSGIRADRDALDRAAAAAAAVGEPGSYLATHDARVYSPQQMVVQLHRMLVRLGWTATSVAASAGTPDPVPNPSGQAGLLFYTDISQWQAGISIPAIKAAGYAGLLARVGEGAQTLSDGTHNMALIDPQWATFSAAGKSAFGNRFAAYWLVGNDETPANQAARCAAAMPDKTIPLMLDCEDGSGTWTNILAVQAAMAAQGIKVTLLYMNPAYATACGATNIAATGLGLVTSRYYVSSYSTPAALYAQMPTSTWNSFAGGTPGAVQFTQNANAGVAGWTPGLDVDAFRGTVDQLAGFFQGAPVVVQPAATVPVGATPPVFPPATWRASLDQGGLAGSHTALGTGNRVPATLPDGQVIDVAKAKLPGGRQGWAFAANLPAGALRVIAQPNIPAPVEGQETWFGFSFLLSRNFPITDGRFHAIAYWVNVQNGACPLMLITSNGKLCLAGSDASGSWVFNEPFCDIDVLNWHDVLMRVKFSKTPGVGNVDIYVDGAPSLLGYAPFSGTLTPTGSTVMTANLRYGFFRDGTAPGEACAYHMNWATGTSFGSVMLPAAG